MLELPNYEKPKFTLPELVLESISKCDSDLQKDLYNSVLLSGGTTMLKGMKYYFIKIKYES